MEIPLRFNGRKSLKIISTLINRWGFYPKKRGKGNQHDLGTSPPLTEVSRALQARNPKKSLENVSRGSWPRDPKKSRKSLGDSPGSLRRVSGKCLESVFGVFWDFLETFWGPGARGPGRYFRDFLGFRARRARETSVRGGLVRKASFPLQNSLLYPSLR